MRPYTKGKGLLALATAVLIAGGCQDFLDVQQTSNPTTESIFKNDADFEAVIGTVFRIWWGLEQSSNPYNGEQSYPMLGLASIAEELTSATNNTGQALDVSQEPRVPYDNDQSGGNFFSRKPFYHSYQCVATAIDALKFLKDPNVIIGDPNNPTIGDHTARAKYWSKMLQGLCHVYEGLIVDQGYVLDDTIADMRKYDSKNNLKPYWEVVAQGVKLLEEAIVMAEAAPLDTIPGATNWINGRVCANGSKECIVNKADPSCAGCTTLVEFMHTMIARAYAYQARTPLQRRTVGNGIAQGHTDWNKVIFHAERGVKKDFYIVGQAAASTGNSSGNDSWYKRYVFNTTNFRIDNRLVGPADTTGVYQAWLAAPLSNKTHIVISTPDRRINGAKIVGKTTIPDGPDADAARDTIANDTTPGFKASGTYFKTLVTPCTDAQLVTAGANLDALRAGNISGMTPGKCYVASQSFSSTRGTYLWSLYQNIKETTTHYNTGNLVTTGPKEMQFLIAEAKLWLGDPGGAAAIINAQGRTAAATVKGGALPALTAAGVPNSPSCVPRRADGTCGTLFDALVYEKRIELSGMAPLVMYADARGWGLLLPGSICNTPIPNREMEAIGLPGRVYTFGGDSPGSVGTGPAQSGATCTDP